MPEPNNKIITFPQPRLMGVPSKPFSEDEADWQALPRTIAIEHPTFEAWMSCRAWELVLPGVKDESQAFGRTAVFLHHVVGMAADVGEVLVPGREMPMQVGFLDGQPLTLRCIRLQSGIRIDIITY